MAEKKSILERASEIVNGNAPNEAKKTEAYALINVIVTRHESGDLRIVEDPKKHIVVPLPAFEYFERTQYAQDCVMCRKAIKKGEPIWFVNRESRNGGRTAALHAACLERERGLGHQSSIFDLLKKDGLV